MSSEAVKKRGRPKKVISDPVEIEMPEGTKKTTTRAKSTKVTPKVVKPAPSTSAKPSVVEKPISKPIASSAPPPKVASKQPGSPAVAPLKPTPPPAKPTFKISTPPETSKILNELREQYGKTASSTMAPAKSSKPSSATTAPKPSSPTPQPKAAPPPASNPTKPAAKPIPTPYKPSSAAAKAAPPPPSAKAAPKPHIPLAALNSEIVSNISTRAGARPNVGSRNPLPKNYKPVARKITMAIVAMPIAIVTSYVLYQRLVLGEDRKLLVKPGLAMVEAPAVAEGKAEGTPSPS